MKLYGDSNDPTVPGVTGFHGGGLPVSSFTVPGKAGVYGFGEPGVYGKANTPKGDSICGYSLQGNGVVGISQNPGEGAGIRGIHYSSGFAGFFEGHVGVSQELRVNGKISTLSDIEVQGALRVNGNIATLGDVQLIGADVAEQFNVVGELAAEPGCVVVLAGTDQVRVSNTPYDRKVAGVVSGAGSYAPGLVLDRRDDASRRPLALAGKVWCKVDADCGPIEIGDMLTTSSTAGHGMRATDPGRAFGAVIGKALGRLNSGRGLLPVLVALQ
jgi:hypothetical protein